jgi:hypothetical protein
LTSKDALENYSSLLTPDERKEIVKYQEIYFLGTEKSKEQLRFNKILTNPSVHSNNS